MNKTTIARALGLLTDVRQTMVEVSQTLSEFNREKGLPNHKPWINTVDEAISLIKNELTVEEVHSYARRNA